MKPEDQKRALAEMDGWKFDHVDFAGRYRYAKLGSLDVVFEELPNYLTSYDAIIPLIKNQDLRTKYNVAKHVKWDYCTTPAQFCEALLREKGRWVE